jgi:uncharacterized protein
MTIYLAHGASGDAASMAPYVDGLVQRGLTARAVSLPVSKAERAVDRYRQQVEDVEQAVIGGHSYGGRVASLLAAEPPAPAGLVLLSYPLHRPGRVEWQARTEHWTSIRCPVLLLSGESDPFARIELLRTAVDRLVDHELVTYAGLGHGLKPVLDQVLTRIAGFVGRL